MPNRNINISEENAQLYPVDDIFEDLPQVDPRCMKIPEDEVTAANPESVAEEASMVALPAGVERVMESIGKHFDLEWPQRENKPASEFMMGFFSKSFPDLFPDGRGGITKPRIGKNPSERDYFKHLMRVSRTFVEHHCFTFVATNMLRRHEALTRGNVFAKHCTANLTMAEMKQAVETNDFRVIQKLLYFAAPITGTRQYFRFKTDQAVSFVKYLRIRSNDKEMFNFFQTFSAADLHWDDLHRLLPNSHEYLRKRIVDTLESVPEEERSECITQTEDAKLRIGNIKRHADIVDAYFKHRIDVLLDKVLPAIGAREHICRYEVQARGTIHAHILLHVEGGPSHQDLLDAFHMVDPPERHEEVKATRDEVARFASHTLGITGMHPNPTPQEWPGPYGQDVQRPATNCLRERFLNLETPAECKEQYEKLCNRCMLHHCREAYCLSKQRRDKTTREMICRFHFPIDLHGFKFIFDHAGSKIIGVDKVQTETNAGAEFLRNELKFLRNHPTVVHHVPELLLLWGANIEGRPVQSYKQVLRYLLKYMFKDEPNSSPFQAITKAVIEATADEEPVRRLFQRLLMKTVGEHDLSKQECHHILNGFDFVQFSMDFVSVNLSGTARVRTPEVEGDDQKATGDNWASIYWSRDSDPNYLKAVEMFSQALIDWDPERVSLYWFVSSYSKSWKRLDTKKVPTSLPTSTSHRRNPQTRKVDTPCSFAPHSSLTCLA